MNAKYRALHEALTRINSTFTGNPLLPSPYKFEDADRVYEMMVAEVPAGTKVRVTYIASPNNPTEVTVREGVVESHSPISLSEPSCHVRFDDTRSGILLPGSVLEAV